MVMLGLNEAIDHLTMASSVCWCGHVSRKEDVLRILLFEDEVPSKKWRLIRTWWKQVYGNSMKCGWSIENVV